MQIIKSESDFLSFIKQEAMSNGNLSIRGVSRCCGVKDTSIIRDAAFNSQKLGQSLLQHGFEAAALIENGFSPEAVWLCIEYFAYDSKAKAYMAKQLARTFGSIGVKTTLEKLKEVEQSKAIKPVRDTVDWVQCAKDIKEIEDPILRSYLTQSLYEDLSTKQLPAASDRLAPIAVIAREQGYKLKPSEDSKLGKHAAQYLEPQGKVPHGRYQVNVYEDNKHTHEVIQAFFR